MSPIPRDDDPPDSDLVGKTSFREGYLGPTSYAAILPKDDDPSPAYDRPPSIASDEDQESMMQQPLTRTMRHQMASAILKSLRRYRRIQNLVKIYWTGSQAGVVPEMINISVLDALKTTVDKYNLTERAPSAELVSTVLENSSKPLDISPTIQAQDFYTLVTGDNLRLEVIGYLLSTAGKACYFGLEPYTMGSDADRSIKSQFIKEMLRSSTMCLILCTLITPVNDIMLWLLFDNLVLTSIMSGMSSAIVWRRLGELATQIYNLGIHRESNTANLPLFLAETRRRMYCAAYTLDKGTSTFLGRPNLLNKRYTDVTLPGDLSDEEICAPPEILALAISNLDENGWNTDSRYFRSSWIRIRYRSSQFREEILDLSLAKLDNDSEHKLMDISRRIRESWDEIPPHLRYRNSCWEEAIPTSVCFMLLIIYLTHFYNDFMVHKLLSPPSPSAPSATLLSLSLTLLTSVLGLSRSLRDRSYDILRDCLHATIVFGVPSASVLASALQAQQRTRQPFPGDISRAEVIRTLAVLISHLESASHIDFAGTRRAGGDYGVCRKAARLFARIVDGVLEGEGVVSAPHTETTNVTFPISSGSGAEAEVSVFGAEEGLVAEIEGEGFGLDLDLFGGIESMDFACQGMGMGIGMSGAFREEGDWGVLGQWAV